jgi:putative NADPH-quinone reductase
MNVLLILAHPNKASFSHAIARTCSTVLPDSGHEAVVHDLYEEHFYPLLLQGELPREAELPAEIKRHCDEVSQADGIIIVQPAALP